MNIIKLHNDENNTPIGVLADCISVIYTTTVNIDGKPRTVSELSFFTEANIKKFCVNETPEKIFQMYDLPQFVKLHMGNNNTTVLVNINAICIVDTEICQTRYKTRLYFYTNSNTKTFVVNESTEKIIEMFKKYKQEMTHSQDQPKDQ